MSYLYNIIDQIQSLLSNPILKYCNLNFILFIFKT